MAPYNNGIVMATVTSHPAAITMANAVGGSTSVYPIGEERWAVIRLPGRDLPVAA